MIGGTMKTTSRFALAAAAGLFVGALAISPAQAADLGGDCCADLEERVAELEATTVRKGNRVVSVQLYGQINRALMIWDDGVDSDAYIVDNDATNSRFGIRGSGTMKPGWTAGFRFEAEINDTESGSSTQFRDGDDSESQNGEFFALRRASVYVESAQLGRITMGQTSAATDDITLINLGGIVGDADNYYAAGFVLRTPGDMLDSDSNFSTNQKALDIPVGPADINGDGDTTDSSVLTGADGSSVEGGSTTLIVDEAPGGDDDLDGDSPVGELRTEEGEDATIVVKTEDERTAGAGLAEGFLTWGKLHRSPDVISREDMIRYDSPSLYGFVLSAAWGDNDKYDFAARFSKEWNSIRIAAGIGYAVIESDEDDRENFDGISGSGGIQHVPSGLFVNFSAGVFEYDEQSSYEAETDDGSLSNDKTFTGVDEWSYWYINGGIERNWTGLGNSSFWVGYGVYEDGAAVGKDVTYNDVETGGLFAVTGSEVNRYVFGFNQDFDSAAMQIYVVGEYYELDSLDVVDIDDADKDGNAVGLGSQDYEDFFSVSIGSRIRF